jgi:hypothetical protein
MSPEQTSVMIEPSCVASGPRSVLASANPHPWRGPSTQIGVRYRHVASGHLVQAFVVEGSLPSTGLLLAFNEVRPWRALSHVECDIYLTSQQDHFARYRGTQRRNHAMPHLIPALGNVSYQGGYLI